MKNICVAFLLIAVLTLQVGCALHQSADLPEQSQSTDTDSMQWNEDRSDGQNVNEHDAPQKNNTAQESGEQTIEQDGQVHDSWALYIDGDFKTALKDARILYPEDAGDESVDVAIPMLTILKESGADVQRDGSVVKISRNGKEERLDLSVSDFGIPLPPGATLCVREILQNEIIMDSVSAEGIFAWFSFDLKINYGKKLVELRLRTETQPEHGAYSFASYDDTERALVNAMSSANQCLHVVDCDQCPSFAALLKQFGNGELALYVPAINGKPIALRNAEGFPGVTLLTSELYDLPWIVYHCDLNGADLRVSISYTSVLESSAVDSAGTYYEVLKLISPNAPSPSNFRQFESYRAIYEKTITLANGQTVTAMISELQDAANRILDIAKKHGAEILILGAFGCGAFQNPPNIVASGIQKAIKNHDGDFETIEFAIYCSPRDTGNYEAFKKVFSDR